MVEDTFFDVMRQRFSSFICSLSRVRYSFFKEDIQPEFNETLESFLELLCLLDAHISTARPSAGVDRYRHPQIRSAIEQTHLHLTAACEIAEKCLKNFMEDNINNSLSKSAKENEIKVLQREIGEHEQRVLLRNSNIATLEGEVLMLHRKVQDVKHSIDKTKNEIVAVTAVTTTVTTVAFSFLGPLGFFFAVRKFVYDNPNRCDVCYYILL